MFQRNFDILGFHKGFSIRTAGNALLQLITAFADGMLTVCLAKQRVAARAVRTTYPQATGDQVPWCDRPTWLGQVSCGQSLSQRLETGQRLPARQLGPTQVFCCERLAPYQKNPLVADDISQSDELLAERTAVRTFGTTTCIVR